MSNRAEFHVMSLPFDGGELHYTASGLDYIYLLNGFTIEDDPDYGRLVTIRAVDDLHRAIGLFVIQQKRRLTGPEFRFLRKQMQLRQKDLSQALGVDVQTVANYEKGKRIPGASETLMRMLFALWLMPPDAKVKVFKELTAAMQRLGNTNCGRLSASKGISPPILKCWQEGSGTFGHA